MRRYGTILIWFGATVASIASPAFAQSDPCGPAPITYGYSSTFQQAQAKYFHTIFKNSSSDSFSLNAVVPIDGIPVPVGVGVSGNGAYENQQAGWDSLTQQQAYQFIQQEHQNYGAQIVDECGYRLCKLLQNKGHIPDSIFESVVSKVIDFQDRVCNAYSGPVDGSGWANSQNRPILSFSPTALTLNFAQNAPPQVRDFQIINSSPDQKTIVAEVSIDYGGSTTASGLVTLLKKGKPWTKAAPLKVVIRPNTSVSVQAQFAKPASTEEVPRIVVRQSGNASVAGSVEVVLSVPAAPALLPGLTKTGQTTSIAPYDDGFWEAGADFDFTDNGDGTMTDNNTGLMWELKSNDGGLHDVDNQFTWFDTFNWIQQVNGEGTSGFAGYNDWRIPNVKELVSVVHFAGQVVGPFAGSSCTPGCQLPSCSCSNSGYHWTSTTFWSDFGQAFMIFMGDGNLLRRNKNDGGGVDPRITVRAVRGGR